MRLKILYAVQGTGNGHLSRAHQLFPYLQEYGEVDFFISGSNYSLDTSLLNVQYESPGFGLFFRKCGKINYIKCFKQLNLKRIRQDTLNIPFEKYDLIINDFDNLTSRACSQRNLQSIHFGHQASFHSEKVPRPKSRSIVGEYILKNFVHATHNIGLHFEKYDESIFTPIIKDELLECSTANHGHITIYLNSFDINCLEEEMLALNHFEFHCFTTEVQIVKKVGNIKYMPMNQTLFNISLQYCHGIVTGGGFETPSEALYLNKKLICMPIKGHYEQMCNATALQKLGVQIDLNIKENFTEKINNWYYGSSFHTNIIPNNIPKTIEHLFNLQHTNIRNNFHI
jgi:uncharacterized protein (TIGR00661 family)